MINKKITLDEIEQVWILWEQSNKKAVLYSLFFKIQVENNAADIFHTDNIVFEKWLLKTILQINIRLNNSCFYAGLFILFHIISDV